MGDALRRRWLWGVDGWEGNLFELIMEGESTIVGYDKLLSTVIP